MTPQRQGSTVPWRRVLLGTVDVVSVASIGVGAIGVGAHLYRFTAHTGIVVAALAPGLMAFAVFGTVGLATRRRWCASAVGLVVIAAAALTQAPMWVGQSAPRDAATVRIMTANLRLGDADARAVVAAAARGDADIVVVQELTAEERSRLAMQGIDRAFPYSIVDSRSGAGGVGLWSRWPIGDAVRHTGFSFALVSAAVEVPGVGRPVTVLSTHMAAPWPQSPYTYFYDFRQLFTLLQAMPDTAPILVGGDFNATWDTAQFRGLLIGGYRDAAEQCGCGQVLTYPGNRAFPPVIGIDHVLTRGAVATNAHSVSIPGSDHRALMVSVAVPATT